MELSEQATVTTKGSKTFILIKAVEGLRGQFGKLPVKDKTRFEAKDAVAFLYKDIQMTLQKGYSMSEISEFIKTSIGWEISAESLRYFCKRFRMEERKGKNATQKKGQSPPEQKSLPMEDKDGAPKAASSSNATGAGEKEESVHHKEKESAHKSAHFELPPDTEDL